MEIETLIVRLKKAVIHNSFRKIAGECDVSHEQIRKLALSNKKPNLTSVTYEKIDKGLVKNGF